MTGHEADDLMMRSLRRLPVLRPDAARAERHLARCRTVISTAHLHPHRFSRVAGMAARIIESAIIGALCVAYVLAVVSDVLRLSGIR